MSEINQLLLALSSASCAEEETQIVEKILELPPHQRVFTYRFEEENNKKIVRFLNEVDGDISWVPLSEKNIEFIYLE